MDAAEAEAHVRRRRRRRPGAGRGVHDAVPSEHRGDGAASSTTAAWATLRAMRAAFTFPLVARAPGRPPLRSRARWRCVARRRHLLHGAACCGRPGGSPVAVAATATWARARRRPHAVGLPRLRRRPRAAPSPRLVRAAARPAARADRHRRRPSSSDLAFNPGSAAVAFDVRAARRHARRRTIVRRRQRLPRHGGARRTPSCSTASPPATAASETLAVARTIDRARAAADRASIAAQRASGVARRPALPVVGSGNLGGSPKVPPASGRGCGRWTHRQPRLPPLRVRTENERCEEERAR